MSQITYTNKETLNAQPSIADKNKVTADDMNEIKSAVNDNNSRITTNSTNITNITGTILWTNPNPTSSISSQSILVNSSDYDILECFYVEGVNNTKRMKSVRVINGNDFFLEFVDTGTMNLINFTRRIGYTSSTQYQITDAYKRESNTAAPNNDYCIPQYIVGYKTGLFS